jgi:hypothetical protein
VGAGSPPPLLSLWTSAIGVDRIEEDVVVAFRVMGPIVVIVLPSAETTTWPTTSWPPVIGLNARRESMAPGAKPLVLGKVNWAGPGSAEPTTW